MSYYINPKNLSSAFTVPCQLADEHLKLCSHLQLKVILHIFRNMASGISAENIADALSATKSDVEDALMYWVSAGILASDAENLAESPSAAPKISVALSEKPSRSDVIRRGNEDKQVMFLLREAQVKFGRNLKSNESSCLLWIYDDLGLDVSVILMLIHFAVTEGRANISFIEKTAVEWSNKGVSTLVDAEKEIADNARRKTAWSMVMSVFGIDKRLPSSKELEFSDCWVNEWKFDRSLLKAAYDACIDSKAKLSMPYVNKILESWHKKGVKTLDDIEKVDAKSKKTVKPTGATYDLDLFEKMINSND